MSENQNKPGPDIRRLPRAPKPNRWTGFLLTALLIFFITGGWGFIMNSSQKGEEVSLNSLLSQIDEGKYERVIAGDNSATVEYRTFKEVEGEEVEVLKRRYANFDGDKTDFNEILSNAEINPKEIKEYKYEKPFNISLGDILSIALLSAGVFLVYMMLRSMQASGGKLMDFGQSKARLIFGKKTGTSFDDVAGIDEVKEELVEIVDFLKNPRKYEQIGARIPRGVLLVGAPGTGKTLLAKAVAGEAGVPFFHASGSEFEEMLVGAGASRVRDLFAKAKKAAPCIVFIDEIDAVAKKRGTVLHAGNGEQTLNQILVEMDGLEGRENVIVLAATNRPDVLDPAILRPGRFDRNIVVSMPDYEGRLKIMKVHAKNKKFDKSANLDTIAKKTIGYSGADLENLLNEAAIMAAKDGRKEISHHDLLESYLKVKLGRQRKNKRKDDDIKRVAYHEAGHAIVSKFTKNAHPVEKISIISRGMSGGVTVYTPQEDSTMTLKSELEAMIKTAVAGKIAEEIFLGEMTTGASGDIRQATEVAKEMVTRYGMSEKLGFVSYGNHEEASYLGYQYGGEKDYSDKTAQAIDEEVKGLIDGAQDFARNILDKNKAKVEELVQMLLEKEEVTREEFEALFSEKSEKKEE